MNIGGGIASKLALKEIEMHVFIHNIPSDHLAPITQLETTEWIRL